MARVSNGAFSGTISNLVFYTVNGINYVRSRPAPRKGKRSQPVNPLNKLFGTVSHYGSQMVTALGKEVLYKLKRNDYPRLRGWMLKQYNQNNQAIDWPLTAYTNGICNVNHAVDIRDCLLVNIGLNSNTNGQLTVSVPMLNPTKQIKAPAHTHTVIIKAIAVSCPFNAKAAGTCTVAVAQHSMLYSNALLAPTELLLDMGINQGEITVLALAMEYITASSHNAMPVMDETWLPAAMVAMGKC
jgi:hypothetical protein